MAGHQWYNRRCGARRRSDGLPCNGVGIAPSYRCKWHGGNLYTDAHREAVSNGLKAFWKHYREAKALGLPWTGKRIGRPPGKSSPKEAPTPRFAPWSWVETDAERRERIARYVEQRFPGAKFRGD